MDDINKITYTSSNGYTGILYGRSSLAVRNKDGYEILHTGFRTINSYKELVDYIEKFPEIWKVLSASFDELFEDEENEQERRKGKNEENNNDT